MSSQDRRTSTLLLICSPRRSCHSKNSPRESYNVNTLQFLDIQWQLSLGTFRRALHCPTVQNMNVHVTERWCSFAVIDSALWVSFRIISACSFPLFCLDWFPFSCRVNEIGLESQAGGQLAARWMYQRYDIYSLRLGLFTNNEKSRLNVRVSVFILPCCQSDAGQQVFGMVQDRGVVCVWGPAVNWVVTWDGDKAKEKEESVMMWPRELLCYVRAGQAAGKRCRRATDWTFSCWVSRAAATRCWHTSVTHIVTRKKMKHVCNSTKEKDKLVGQSYSVINWIQVNMSRLIKSKV